MELSVRPAILIYALPLVFLGLVTSWIISATVRDPLRHVPGPWWARYTRLPILWTALKGTQIQFTHSLHRQYGPVLRVSPREISFNGIESFRTIHKIGGSFRKDESYKFISISYGKYDSLLNMRDPKAHSQRRRLFSKPLAQVQLRKNWQGMVQNRVKLAVERMRAEMMGGGRSIDAAVWIQLLSSDISSWLSFGEHFGCLEAGEKPPYVHAIELTPFVAVLHMGLPEPLYSMVESLPWPARVRAIFDVEKLLMDSGVVAVKNSRPGSNKANLFAQAINGSDKDGSGALDDVDVQVEAGMFMVAGTGTTATTLHALLWAVLSQPDLQATLEKEAGAVEDFSDENLEKLPILNAVIDETLRLYAPGNGPLSRDVPPGGATIHGVFVPEGTVVAAAAYLFHRDPTVFPDPYRFDHTRFLPMESEAVRERRRLTAPWGGGSRTCVGLHLAQMVLRRLTIEFFRECRGVRLALDMPPSGDGGEIEPDWDKEVGNGKGEKSVDRKDGIQIESRIFTTDMAFKALRVEMPMGK